MSYYIVTFAIAIMFASIAERYNKRDKTSKVKAFLLLSAITFGILAGIRDNSVGTDISYYAESCFNRVCGTNSLFTFLKMVTIEPGYAFLAFVVSRFTTELGWMLFFSQILVVGPLYIASYLKRKNLSFSMVAVVYAFWFFCFSLNIMRQSIACALIVLFYVLWQKQKKVLSGVVFVLACLFHQSAIFGALVVLFSQFACSGRAKKMSLIKKWGIIAAFIVAMFSFMRIVSILATMNILSSEYSKRVLASSGESAFTPIEYILRAFILFMPLLLTKIRIGSHDECTYVADYDDIKLECQLFNYILIVGFILSFGRMISAYLIRLVYYCNYFTVIYVAIVSKIGLKFKSNRYALRVIEIVLCVFYWYTIYIKLGWHAVTPFHVRF